MDCLPVFIRLASVLNLIVAILIEFSDIFVIFHFELFLTIHILYFTYTCKVKVFF